MAATIETYLKGKVSYTEIDKAIPTILEDRGIAAGTLAADVTLEKRELCTADLYVFCSTQAAVTSMTEDTDAGWKHREGSSESAEWMAKRFISMARAIYAKYGEEHPELDAACVFKIVTL